MVNKHTMGLYVSEIRGQFLNIAKWETTPVNLVHKQISFRYRFEIETYRRRSRGGKMRLFRTHTLVANVELNEA